MIGEGLAHRKHYVNTVHWRAKECIRIIFSFWILCSSGTSICPLLLCYLPFSYLYCPQHPPPAPGNHALYSVTLSLPRRLPLQWGQFPLQSATLPLSWNVSAALLGWSIVSGTLHYSFSLVYSVIFAGAQSQAISLKKDALEVNFLRWSFFLIDRIWPGIQILVENHPQNFEDMKIFHLLLLGKIWCHFGTRPFPGNTYFSSSKVLMASVSAVLTFHVNMSACGFSCVHFLEHSVDLFWRIVSFHCGNISCIIC